jgi:hypothetical protein
MIGMKYAYLLIRRNQMKNEKMMCKVLLDLCAFACTQDPGDRKARDDYEEAYRLAQNYDLPDLKTYRDYMETVGYN